MIYGALLLALRLLFYSVLANALPLSTVPSSTNVNVASTSTNLIHSYNGTTFGIPVKVLTSLVTLIVTSSGPSSSNLHYSSFPPGPPSNPFFYTIPGSELMLEFSPLGLIPDRNESLVSRVLFDAIHTSLDYRVNAKMPGHGYKLQDQNFVVSVTHTVGKQELTWGMWTIILTGMIGYVQAYPGYDFLFEIRLMEAETLAGSVIGAGFAVTRR